MKRGAGGSMKRIMQEVVEMAEEAEKPNKMFVARPLETDLFEWHFSVKGPPETAFEGGVYHGRILLPSEYPFKAEGLGSLDFPDEDRRKLARQSASWVCPSCGVHPYAELSPAPSAEAETPHAPDVQAESAVEEDARLQARAQTDSRDEAQDSMSAQQLPGESSESIEDRIREGPTPPQIIAAATPAPPLRLQAMVQETRRTIPVPLTEDVVAGDGGKEKELLYIAYALLFGILAIVARRAFISFATI